MTVNERLATLVCRALEGGGPERIERQHASGKLTARERIAVLVDPGSWLELDQLVASRTEPKSIGDGVVVGTARVNGRAVCLYAQDFTVSGGSLGAAHAAKIVKIMDLAMKIGAPVIGLSDSGGARIQEGVAALAGYADIFYRNTLASGVVPQLSCIMGPSAGGAVYSPAITDFVFMVEGTAHMFITGPDVIRAVTHEDVTKEVLGGAATHASRSGVAHFTSPTDSDCLALVRKVLEYLPSNNLESPPRAAESDSLGRPLSKSLSLIPEDSSRPYDMVSLLGEVFDEDSLLQVHEAFAPNIVTAFARLGGDAVGVVANQPRVLAGVLDIDASVKAARFVRFCDSFNIPLITFVDVPGFLPGVDQEHRGIILHGAKLLYAYCEATVPKLTLIVRKAYGGAYDVMSSKHIGADINLALPSAEIAVMGSAGAVNIMYRREIAEAVDPEAKRAALLAEYQTEYANPFRAAELGFIDEVVPLAAVRQRLGHYLRLLRDKRVDAPRKKHGNMPL